METRLTKGENPMRERIAKKSLILAAGLVTALFIMSCIAAIPIAVKYAESKKQTKAEAEMPVPAEKVYSTAVDLAKEKGLQIVKEEDDNMYLEVTDGVQTASLKAEAAGSDKTEITVTANLPSEEGENKEQRKEKEKELTLRIVNRLCERLEVKCTITKE
jgi:uncharacterized protein YcnI